MKRRLLIIFSAIFVLQAYLFAGGNNVPEVIINSLKNGDATELSKHFNNTIELTINGNEQIYSKTQAELILKNFFKENPPSEVKVLHQSGKEAWYAILSMKSGEKSYRITLLIKEKDSKNLIHQLRIE
ncbi:MAG: DUF4783 domain-containing protein [Bacteroidales bacterium]|nr:DUF4783 domain-containing protein [Bacteroidales bacterium]